MELMIDRYENSPTGSPTERLVWLALYHNDRHRYMFFAGKSPYQIHRHVGGSLRSVESALASLLKRDIIERKLDEDLGWVYRLTDRYAQPRYPRAIDRDDYLERTRRESGRPQQVDADGNFVCFLDVEFPDVNSARLPDEELPE